MAGIQPRPREQGPLVWRSLSHGKDAGCSEAGESILWATSWWTVSPIAVVALLEPTQTVAVLADSCSEDTVSWLVFRHLCSAFSPLLF